MATLRIYEPDRSFRVWELGEIHRYVLSGSSEMIETYEGYVPNIKDLVADTSGNVLYEVTDLNTTTKVAELSPWTPLPVNPSGLDILLGSTPSFPEMYFRVRVDKSVTPHILDVDPQLYVKSTDATYAKVFLGGDISENGTVISQVYDQNNNFLSENIPLSLVQTNAGQNYAVKQIDTAKTSHDLNNGELVTVVIYGSNGNALSISPLTVMETSFVRRIESESSYISDIELLSPFRSTTEVDTLVVPANVLQESLALRARIHYTDGSTINRNIDQNKVKLYGFNELLMTTPGTTHKLTLVYILGEDEGSTETTTGAYQYGHRAKSYDLRVIAADNAYVVKLYAVPKWTGTTNGWELEYYLHLLDRNGYFHATQHIYSGVNATPFDGTLYNQTQTITVSTMLRDIDPSLPEFIFSQSFRISLLGPGTLLTDSYTINYSTDPALQYGVGVRADVVPDGGGYLVDISSGETDFNVWLDKLYTRTLPLYDSQIEAQAPTPTHFILTIGGVNYRMDINQWDQSIPVSTTDTIGNPVMLHWIREVGSTDLYLGTSPLKIYV